jgi:hypothetical protein
VPLGAASDDPVPRGPSTLLIDIRDPSQPTIVDAWPIAGYGHSVIATDVANRTYVVSANVATAGTDTYDVFDLLATPLGERLEHLSTITPDIMGPVGTDLGGHSEAYLAVHPITRKPVLYIQDRQYVRTYDFTDPTQPKLLGTWTDDRPDRQGFSGNMHSLWPMADAWSGKHYLVAGPEYGGHPTGVPSGIVWVLDDTDPSHLKEVAAWTLPHDVEWSGEYMFSTHYFAVQGRTLFVSMYHAGIWAVDLRGLPNATGFTLLPSVGVFEPALSSPKPPAHPVRWAPTVEEVRPLPDGTMITFDSNSGLYAFRYDEAHPMPAPTPWPIPPLR